MVYESQGGYFTFGTGEVPQKNRLLYYEDPEPRFVHAIAMGTTSSTHHGDWEFAKNIGKFFVSENLFSSVINIYWMHGLWEDVGQLLLLTCYIYLLKVLVTR